MQTRRKAVIEQGIPGYSICSKDASKQHDEVTESRISSVRQQRQRRNSRSGAAGSPVSPKVAPKSSLRPPIRDAIQGHGTGEAPRRSLRIAKITENSHSPAAEGPAPKERQPAFEALLTIAAQRSRRRVLSPSAAKSRPDETPAPEHNPQQIEAAATDQAQHRTGRQSTVAAVVTSQMQEPQQSKLSGAQSRSARCCAA